MDVPDSARVADELVMLRDGAMVTGYLSDPRGVGEALATARACGDRLPQLSARLSVRPLGASHALPRASLGP